jgi:hypothetical protein
LVDIKKAEADEIEWCDFLFLGEAGRKKDAKNDIQHT